MLPDFTKNLLEWHRLQNTRRMPWKSEKDPYKIWLSEVILQQTRVEQGWGYYERFISAFPTVQALANAPEKKVFKLWEGLGYYNRCRNLLDTAKLISSQFGGRFPATYEQILLFKGIGPYTAAAIASFAFNLPYAVVDGNVERVLARYFGITATTRTAAGKKFFAGMALALLDKKQAAVYNQAIMDFGAVVCKPNKPLCARCVQQSDCMAFNNHWIDSLPVRQKTVQRKDRWFYYFLIETADQRLYMRKRNGKDIWKNLYEFVLWETDHLISKQEFETSPFIRQFLGSRKYSILGFSAIQKQALTHQTIQGRFIYLRIGKPLSHPAEYSLIKLKKAPLQPLPKLIREHLQNPHYTPEF